MCTTNIYVFGTRHVNRMHNSADMWASLSHAIHSFDQEEEEEEQQQK